MKSPVPVYDTESKLADALSAVSQCDTTSANKQTLKTFRTEAEAAGLKPITVERYLWCLVQIVEYINWEIANPSQQQLKQLVADINNARLWGDDISPWTRKKYKTALSKLYEYIAPSIDLSFMSINVPRSEQKELTPNKYPTRADAASIVKTCNNRRDKALIAGLWDTGARISELLQLQWQHIDFDNQTATIERGKTGSRTIPIVESVNRLRAWYETCLWSDGYVFGKLRGSGDDCISYKRAVQIINNAAADTDHNADKINPHSWRKGRACWLARQDAFNAFQLAQWMGWSDLETARHYIKIVTCDLQNSIEKAVGDNSVI